MRQDDCYLLDMLVAARKAVLFAQGLTYEQFAQSDLHQNAIFKVLEIVGEAASRLSDNARSAHPEIPWSDVRPSGIGSCMLTLKQTSGWSGRLQ